MQITNISTGAEIFNTLNAHFIVHNLDEAHFIKTNGCFGYMSYTKYYIALMD